MRRFVITTFLAALALCAATVSAQAAPVRSFYSGQAITWLSNHPDGGGNGVWATESFRRVFRLQLTGVHLGVYSFEASITDNGQFATVPDAYTPNQGAPYTGDKINGIVSGYVYGGTTYTFTANHLPNHWWNLGIPFFEHGVPVGDETTSLWFEQAFPHGTVFTGGIDNDWSWSYSTRPCFHFPFFTFPEFVSSQHWADGFPSDGQLPADGNITGC